MGTLAVSLRSGCRQSSAIPFKRPGVVRAQGRCLVDDLGIFHPLGATLFWAPRGWREDRDRLNQNLQSFMAAGFDYIRILCAVDWAGEEIDPTWPDYQQVLAELIDYTYDELGMRVEADLVRRRCLGTCWSLRITLVASRTAATTRSCTGKLATRRTRTARCRAAAGSGAILRDARAAHDCAVGTARMPHRARRKTSSRAVRTRARFTLIGRGPMAAGARRGKAGISRSWSTQAARMSRPGRAAVSLRNGIRCTWP